MRVLSWPAARRALATARRSPPRPAPRLESDLEEAWRLFARLDAAGVDYDDVVATLEREGIEKVVASFNQLLKGIADKRRELTAAA